MADFAAPLLPTTMLLVWSPAKEPKHADTEGRRLVNFIQEECYPKYIEARNDGTIQRSKLNLKDYIIAQFFPVVDEKFNITGRYALEDFKKVCFTRIALSSLIYNT